MLRLIARTLVQTVALVFLVSALVFVLQALVPGDAARAILGTTGTEEQYIALREQLGLDLPLWQQYFNYWAVVFNGSFGTTLVSHQPVLPLILQRLPVTLSLVILSTALATMVGVVLGVLAAIRGRRLGAVIDAISLGGLAFPNFWIAILLVTLFSVTFRLFPATGYVDLHDSPIDWARSLVLPVVALAIGGVALVAKSTRDGMLDNLSRDHIRTLRANGVSEARIVWRHGLKGTAVQILSVVNVSFVGALSGTVLIESVFALNGLGSLMTDAVGAHEIYQVVGVSIIFTLLVAIMNLLVDLAYGWVNPRVRRGRA